MRISPPDPTNFDQLKIKESDLVDLLLKLIFVHGLENTLQFSADFKRAAFRGAVGRSCHQPHRGEALPGRQDSALSRSQSFAV